MEFEGLLDVISESGVKLILKGLLLTLLLTALFLPVLSQTNDIRTLREMFQSPDVYSIVTTLKPKDMFSTCNYARKGKVLLEQSNFSWAMFIMKLMFITLWTSLFAGYCFTMHEMYLEGETDGFFSNCRIGCTRLMPYVVLTVIAYALIGFIGGIIGKHFVPISYIIKTLLLPLPIIAIYGKDTLQSYVELVSTFWKELLVIGVVFAILGFIPYVNILSGYLWSFIVAVFIESVAIG